MVLPKVKRITTPLTKEIAGSLRSGDEVLISGEILTARDAAHIRFMKLIEAGEELPVDLKNQIIYYTGPAPAKPGYASGPAGPTTSGRMDIYTPVLLERGLTGMMGKGKRSAEVINAMKKNKAVYFGVTGGVAALIAKSIKSVKTVAYEDLGTEAVHRMTVEELPAIVVIDSNGIDLYDAGPEKYKKVYHKRAP